MLGWFKGMEIIIHEWGIWPMAGLWAQCDGFKCEAGWTDCCCQHVMFSQPDFVAQKSHLEEYITSRGHICDFYSKFHCKLNFIEQYWGTVKLHYQSSPKTADMDAMECNLQGNRSLATCCWDQISRFAFLDHLSWETSLCLDFWASCKPTEHQACTFDDLEHC